MQEEEEGEARGVEEREETLHLVACCALLLRNTVLHCCSETLLCTVVLCC